MQENEKEPLLNEDVVTNKSVRWADSTHKKMKELADVRGKSFDEMQKELLALYNRTSLEDDREFGSQIEQVNELLMRVGDKFSGMVSHANVKIENQEARYQKLELEASEEIKELKETVKGLKQQLKEIEERNKELVKNKQEAEIEKWKLEDQLAKKEKENEERIAELKDVLKAKEEKIADKKLKIDALDSEISGIKEELSKVDEMRKKHKEETEHLQSANTELTDLIEEQADRMESLERNIVSINEKHKLALERQEEKLSIERERALIGAEREFQRQLADIHREHNQKITALYERLRVKEEKALEPEQSTPGQTNIDDFMK